MCCDPVISMNEPTGRAAAHAPDWYAFDLGSSGPKDISIVAAVQCNQTVEAGSDVASQICLHDNPAQGSRGSRRSHACRENRDY